MTKKQETRKLRAEKLTCRLRGQPRKSQRGQILIIVVFAIVGLVAFVGLVVDTGLVFIGNGKLRRSVDAAALAAASEYRKNPNPVGLSTAAKEFLKLNNVEDPNATVFVCNHDPLYVQYFEADLCTTPAQRRLVKVNATSTIGLAFLPVIGIRSVTLSATATSEAASLDIVLALDVSESMTFDNAPGKPGATPLYLDPAECNNVPAGDYTVCAPFSDIQHAAVAFVETLITNDNAYDRVAVIPFDRKAHTDKADAYNAPLYLGDQASYATPALYRAKIEDTIKGLRVYTGSGTVSGSGNAPIADGSCLDGNGLLHYPSQAPCRLYPANDDASCFDQPPSNPPTPLGTAPTDNPPFGPNDNVFNDPTCFSETTGTTHTGPFWNVAHTVNYERAYNYLICPPAFGTSPAVDFKYCGTTNTGGAFLATGDEYTRMPGFRQESLWIMILLTDGKADHSDNNAYCPSVDLSACQDAQVQSFNAGTRHCLPYTPADPLSLYWNNQYLYDACIHVPTVPSLGTGGVVNSAMYDADDYARDMADFVALGQSALIYTIGFGAALDSTPPTGNPNSPGEQLLNYAADIGDDGKIDTGPGTLNTDYFYAHDATALQKIFQTISDRISTRLTH